MSDYLSIALRARQAEENQTKKDLEMVSTLLTLEGKVDKLNESDRTADMDRKLADAKKASEASKFLGGVDKTLLSPEEQVSLADLQNHYNSSIVSSFVNHSDANYAQAPTKNPEAKSQTRNYYLSIASQKTSIDQVGLLKQDMDTNDRIPKGLPPLGLTDKDLSSLSSTISGFNPSTSKGVVEQVDSAVLQKSIPLAKQAIKIFRTTYENDPSMDGEKRIMNAVNDMMRDAEVTPGTQEAYLYANAAAKAIQNYRQATLKQTKASLPGWNADAITKGSTFIDGNMQKVVSSDPRTIYGTITGARGFNLGARVVGDAKVYGDVMAKIKSESGFKDLSNMSEPALRTAYNEGILDVIASRLAADTSVAPAVRTATIKQLQKLDDMMTNNQSALPQAFKLALEDGYNKFLEGYAYANDEAHKEMRAYNEKNPRGDAFVTRNGVVTLTQKFDIFSPDPNKRSAAIFYKNRLPEIVNGAASKPLGTFFKDPDGAWITSGDTMYTAFGSWGIGSTVNKGIVPVFNKIYSNAPTVEVIGVEQKDGTYKWASDAQKQDAEGMNSNISLAFIQKATGKNLVAGLMMPVGDKNPLHGNDDDFKKFKWSNGQEGYVPEGVKNNIATYGNSTFTKMWTNAVESKDPKFVQSAIFSAYTDRAQYAAQMQIRDIGTLTKRLYGDQQTGESFNAGLFNSTANDVKSTLGNLSVFKTLEMQTLTPALSARNADEIERVKLDLEDKRATINAALKNFEKEITAGQRDMILASSGGESFRDAQKSLELLDKTISFLDRAKKAYGYGGYGIGKMRKGADFTDSQKMYQRDRITEVAKEYSEIYKGLNK